MAKLAAGNPNTGSSKVHPGFVVVISRSPELAKVIAKVGLVGEKAEKPSADALGHKFYAPTSMDENAEEESAEAVYGPMRVKIARLLEQEPLSENASTAERFYYMFLQVRRFVVFRDAVKKINDRKAKQSEKMTEEEMEELWEKVKRKQTQKMEELKFMGEIMTPLMAKLPKRADRVMDMAGGTGDLALATAMSMMEAGHPISKATIIDPFVTTTRDFTDFVIEHLPNSEKFREIIDPQAKSLQEAEPSINDVVVAKHSCGTLTDDIIEQWMASESPMLCIMTCCHDKAKNESARYDLSQSEWQKLCKASSKTNSEDPETWKKGMEAMTKLDTARVDYLKRHGFEAELHQTDQFPKGDVIVARRKKY